MRSHLMLVLVSCFVLVASGCAGTPPTDGGVDAAVRDAGPSIDAHAPSDASAEDAAGDASVDDAAVALDASEDAALVSDASVPIDGGPIDGGITRTEDAPTHPAAAPIAPFTACTVTTATDVISGAAHRTPCDPIAYPFHPPSAGDHFSQWATSGTYSAPIPWGFLVHSMEHGAVVLAYHCDDDADCAAVRAEYASIIADHGVDPVCRLEDGPSRFIVVPDPTLPVPIAAVSWRHVYTATCLDPPSLRAFVDAHYGMSPENLCVPGVDRSATGWCP